MTASDLVLWLTFIALPAVALAAAIHLRHQDSDTWKGDDE